MNTKNTLIIGGGIAGMCLAIELRKKGHPVELIEIDPAWRIEGAGISIMAATLRAFLQIGVLDEIIEQGWCSDGFSLSHADGTPIGHVSTPRLAGEHRPGSGAIMRPVLAAILAKATRASGTTVRLGVSFTSIEQIDEQVRVGFSDGTSGVYDVVVGADGVMSKTRATILPDVPAPEFTGQGSWRAVVPRPAEIDHCTFFIGKTTKAGVNPVSKDEAYVAVLESKDSDARVPQETWLPALKELLKEFSGTMGALRDGLNADSRIVYRPLHKLLVTPPWHQGRVGLIGDAIHATTPHLASGAGLGVEDAIVLAEELSRHAAPTDAFAAFTARRFERCKLVVEGSARVGVLERAGTQEAKEEHGNVMRTVIQTLIMPI
jgi:2-polyprenyl-6-methoxyphenol hydroxylase-like FAD-dependent oxidoreductase